MSDTALNLFVDKVRTIEPIYRVELGKEYPVSSLKSNKIHGCVELISSLPLWQRYYQDMITLHLTCKANDFYSVLYPLLYKVRENMYKYGILTSTIEYYNTVFQNCSGIVYDKYIKAYEIIFSFKIQWRYIDTETYKNMLILKNNITTKRSTYG